MKIYDKKLNLYINDVYKEKYYQNLLLNRNKYEFIILLDINDKEKIEMFLKKYKFVFNICTIEDESTKYETFIVYNLLADDLKFLIEVQDIKKIIKHRVGQKLDLCEYF